MAAPSDDPSSVINDVFTGIKCFISVSKSSNCEQQESKSRLLEAFLTNSMESLHQSLDDATVFKDAGVVLRNKQTDLKSMITQCADVKWVYVEHCLALLESLAICFHDAMEAYEASVQSRASPLTPNMAPRASPDTLSVAQQAAVSTLVQFTVCLGVCPALLRGVGLPVSVRSSSVDWLDAQCERPLPFRERQRRLVAIARVFTRCSEQPSLGGLLLSKNLNDLLAMLVQLTCTDDIQRTIKVRKQDGSLVSPTNVNSALCSEDIDFARSKLQYLSQHCYQPSVIRELLVLQGGVWGPAGGSNTPVPKPPPWLRRVCGGLLAERVMAPKGVASFLTGVMDTGDPSAESWSRLAAIGKLLATCPSAAVPTKTYMTNVSSQLLALLRTGDNALTGPVTRVISSCVVVMVTSDVALTKQCFLDPLFRPLLVKDHIEDGSCQVVASEHELASCLGSIHKVFVTGKEPHPTLLPHLSPVLHALFNLYCFCLGGVCNLRSSVEEILVTCLRQLDYPACLAAMEHISSIKQHSEYGCQHERALFSPGSSGGAVLVYQGEISTEELFTHQLMGHEHIAACCGSLLLKVAREKLSADFFIAVLNEMTSIVTSLNLVDQSSVTKDLSSAALSSNTDLLHLEPSSQVKKIQEVQHALRVLAVLEQMCGSLGPGNLTNLSHMLQFCLAALRRCVDRLRREGAQGEGAQGEGAQGEGAQGEGGGEVPGMLETETLTLAIGLLSAIITGPQQKKMADAERQILQDSLPLLQTLAEEHFMESIRKLANDLAIAIATHGTVSSATVAKAGKRSKPVRGGGTQSSGLGRSGKGRNDMKAESSSKTGRHEKQDGKTDNSAVDATQERKSHIGQEAPDDPSSAIDSPAHPGGSMYEVGRGVENAEEGRRSGESQSQNERTHTDNVEMDSENSKNTELDAKVESAHDHIEYGEGGRTRRDSEIRGESLPEEEEGREMCGRMGEVIYEPLAGARTEVDNEDDNDEGEEDEEDGNNDNRGGKPLDGDDFDQAMEDLHDPLLPVRGHGLIILARLVRDRHPGATARSHTLLEVFEEHLFDDDTYIYLPSINGLVALAALHPARVLPHLCEAYKESTRGVGVGVGAGAGLGQTGSRARQEAAMEKTLKLGEALVRATREMGELVPHYRNLLLNAVMAGSRHGEGAIRASSLSHLGEICQLLRFSLGPVVHEVLECVTSAIRNDPEPEVKRSAVQVINLLLRGLGKDAIQVLDVALRDVYRCLKAVRARETDEVLVLHVDLALEELDLIMRDYLFPKQSLTKRITVLNP